MSITFGSVGDIIAVGQIAWSLAQALTDSKGSAKEYQDLVKELRAFERAVLQVCPNSSWNTVIGDLTYL
jgi:hypothetical protein